MLHWPRCSTPRRMRGRASSSSSRLGCHRAAQRQLPPRASSRRALRCAGRQKQQLLPLLLLAVAVAGAAAQPMGRACALPGRARAKGLQQLLLTRSPL